MKLVDDTQFVGSLNIADPYAGVRYGCGSFRDFNAIVSGYGSEGIRKFFKDHLLKNVQYHKEVISEAKI